MGKYFGFIFIGANTVRIYYNPKSDLFSDILKVAIFYITKLFDILNTSNFLTIS